MLPWVLSDYTSKTIDLNDPSCYRDLACPIGALNPANHSKLDEAYNALQTMHDEVGDPQAAPPPFYYGSHYSSMGVVLFFLIRLEPFTTQQLLLQGGRFDHADRLFHSFGASMGFQPAPLALPIAEGRKFESRARSRHVGTSDRGGQLVGCEGAYTRGLLPT